MNSILAVGPTAASRHRGYQDLKAALHQELLKRLNLERLTRVSREDAEPEIRALIVELIDGETQKHTAQPGRARHARRRRAQRAVRARSARGAAPRP